MKDNFSIINHYKKLWFFNFNRFKDNNYARMSAYFAHVLLYEIEEFIPLWDKKVLDVGGATGEFCKFLSQVRRCDSTNLDPSPGNSVWPKTMVGNADNIPFTDNEFDVVICRGVLEHIPNKNHLKSMAEMYRVTKSGGLCYVLIPPWFNPHAGHELKPFHVLPFPLAKQLKELFSKQKIRAESLEDLNLYKITFKEMIKLISTTGFTLLSTRDTHFRLHVMTKIPIVRDLLVPAVAFILVKLR